jgi:SAM-dependent methyltransferase
MENAEQSRVDYRNNRMFILYHPLQTPLYEFLKQCNANPLEKEVLGCGTGGERPSLALFYAHGYKTYGIDNSNEQLELAQVFCRENNMELNVMKGDIRTIPFKDDSVNFVYSINTLCHLSKKDTAVAMREMKRVLRPEGLLCVNFSSIDDVMSGCGQEVSKGEFLQELEWYPGIVQEGHVCSYYEKDEPDPYFQDFEVIVKMTRIVELPIYKSHPEGGDWQVGDIFYIAKK